MKMKNKYVRILAVLSCLLMLLPVVVSAASYKTYTYSIDGAQLLSPDAYTPNRQIDSAEMNLPMTVNDKGEQVRETLNTPDDLVVDSKGNVYIADSSNNCIYALDSNFKFRFKITSFVNSQGVDDALSGCKGCFVTDKYIYVADTNKNRIVIFDLEGKYVRHLDEPEADIFEDNAIYKPIALAVDATERLYVVSSTTYQGILSLDKNGVFQAYVGAQKVAYSAWDIFWRQFQTPKQRALSVKNVPTEYNNITIDSTGFIYVTTSSIGEGNQQNAIYSKKGEYAPVKKYNAAGKDILGRNGFYGPGGEVWVNYSPIKSDITGPSKIIDVALGPAGSWSIIDEKRSKVYTYDQYGQLLFIFGDKGSMLGNIQKVSAIAYQGTNILLLDSTSKTITLYTRTEYGDILIKALQNEIDRNYDAAVTDYQDILQRNSNFDAAYIGIGKAYYRQSKYAEAMKMFESAYETANYSNAFKMQRQQWANKYFIVIPIVVVVILVAIVKFFGYAHKVNKSVTTSSGKRTFKQEVMYAFHVIFHPFDGFWDLKHEKRGSVRGAVFYLVIALIAVCYNSVGKAYIFNPRASYSSMFMTCISLLVPVILWVIANWCLTTLFDGEGSIRDIFIATCYSLVPLILFMIPATALTNVFTLNEASIYNMLISIGWAWVMLLLFFGTMVTHDYSLLRNVLTSIGTIVGMAFIMFCGVLFSTLLVKMVNFISGIVTEITYRM